MGRPIHDDESKDDRSQANAGKSGIAPEEEQAPAQHTEDRAFPNFVQPRPFDRVEAVMADADLGGVRMDQVNSGQ